MCNTFLSDLLLVHLDTLPELQNKMCLLLESWWLKEKDDREGMVPNMILYLVARSLDDGAKVRRRG